MLFRSNTIDVAHILGQPISAEALVDRYDALPIKNSSDLIVDGRFLIKNGIEPGPKLGILLNSIREKVVEGELENSKAAIKQFIEEQN